MTDENEKDKVRVLAATDGGRMLIADSEGIKSISPVKDGEPINTDYDLYQLEPTDEPLVLSRTTLYKGKGPGPAKVTSPQYRDGWDAVFKGPKRWDADKKPKREDMN